MSRGLTRCQPGDLALVIHSEAGNEGREVTVVRRVRDGDRHDGTLLLVPQGFGPCWLVQARELRAFTADGELRTGTWGILPDTWLMPLRPHAQDADRAATERPQQLPVAA